MKSVIFDNKGKDITPEELSKYLYQMQNETSSLVNEPETQKASAYNTLVLASALSLAVSTGIASNSNRDVVFTNTESTSIKDYEDFIVNPYDNYLLELKQLICTNIHLKNDVIKSIVSFRSLESNWDGYGAYPLEVLSAQNAVELITSLSDKTVNKISDYFNNPNGTISFVWENTSEEQVSVEIGNKTFSYFKKLNSLTPVFYNNLAVEASNISNLQMDIGSLFI